MRDSAHIDTRKLTANFVYTHPSVTRLASFVFTLVHSGGTDNGGDTSSLTRINDMRAMLSRYSYDFLGHSASANGRTRPNADVVLITGTTGSLGSYVLSLLAFSADVSRVYAFNRKSTDGRSLLERQKSALLDRGLNPLLLDLEKVTLLEGDLLAEHFGLSNPLYEVVSVSFSVHILYYH